MPGEGQGLLALAQSAAIARAMASLCNDERGCFGVQGGHGRKTLSLSDIGCLQLDAVEGWITSAGLARIGGD